MRNFQQPGVNYHLKITARKNGIGQQPMPFF